MGEEEMVSMKQDTITVGFSHISFTMQHNTVRSLYKQDGWRMLCGGIVACYE